MVVVEGGGGDAGNVGSGRGLDGKRDDECDDQGLWGSGYCSSGWYIGMNWYDVLDHCGGSCAERKKERGRQRGTPEERTGFLVSNRE